MSELKAYKMVDEKYCTDCLCVIPSEVYLKSEADKVIAEKDAAIAELKQKLDKAIAERDGNQVCIDALKQKLENVQASAYADSVDAGMRERRLRRALYKACANWADVVAFEETEGIGHDNSVAERWRKMESKCLAKAKEYK